MKRVQDVHNIEKWMERLAEALEYQDVELIEQLKARSSDWMQMDSARKAQHKLADAAHQLIEDYWLNSDGG